MSKIIVSGFQDEMRAVVVHKCFGWVDSVVEQAPRG